MQLVMRKSADTEVSDIGGGLNNKCGRDRLHGRSRLLMFVKRITPPSEKILVIRYCKSSKRKTWSLTVTECIRPESVITEDEGVGCL